GLVELDAPIRDATISVYDTKGILLYREEKATRPTGAFNLQTPKWLPADFRIEASGGVSTVDNQAFSGTLAAEIRKHDAQKYSYYHLGPVSTLLALYMKKHPGIAYEPAKAKVMGFLGLAPGIDITTALVANKVDFHPGVFMIATKKAGGFDPFIASLVQSIDKGEAKTYDFSAKALPGGLVTVGVAGELVKWLLVNLAAGAVQRVGSEGAGWVIKSIVGGDENTPPGIKKELQGISDKLDSLAAQMDNLNSKLDQVLQLIKETSYYNRAQTLNRTVSMLQSRTRKVALVGRLEPSLAEDRTSAQAISDEIKVGDIEDALQEIHNSLVGTAQLTSLLKEWGDMQLQKSWTEDRYQYLEDMFAYYGQAELCALNLLVEKLHAAGRGTKEIEYEIDTYKGFMKAQGDMFLSQVEQMMAWSSSVSGYNGLYQSEWGFKWNEGGSHHAMIDVFGLRDAPRRLQQADMLVGQLLGKTNTVTLRIYWDERNGFAPESKPNLGRDDVTLRLWDAEPNVAVSASSKSVVSYTYPPHKHPWGSKVAYVGQFARFTFDVGGKDQRQHSYKIYDDSKTWPNYIHPKPKYTIQMVHREFLSYDHLYWNSYPPSYYREDLYGSFLIWGWLTEQADVK
ncbi:MAG: hypothetical protein HW402_319, partial [Dehalococcoidales bacterium]|nr:hypothetical protein [Dehalococcoidales bacterium]